jgi:hypothetical protein
MAALPQLGIESHAPNSPEAWDRIWSNPAEAEWRSEALAAVYDRIVELVPDGASVVDLGGGVGTLARKLRAAGRRCLVVDCSPEACSQAGESVCGDVASENTWRQIYEWIGGGEYPVVVATEVLEHLTPEQRTAIYRHSQNLIASVPNDRLGPEEEPQHTIRWSALEFLTELRRSCLGVHGARVEVPGPFLLGVAGPMAGKKTTLSVCTPARDEAADIERTLASFRGVADEIIVGVDPRSSDETEAIARRYAEHVFTLEDPQGPPEDRAAKIHMAHVRNQCMDRCSMDWIFMTEAHESLLAGQDALLQLDELPKGSRIGFVLRTGSGQQWGFPWLCRNDPRIRYKRKTHNVLDFPLSYLCVRLRQIKTLHQRAADTVMRRREQRRVQNRASLLDDWYRHGNVNSLLYLGSEFSEYSPEKAIERLQEFLDVARSQGAQRYHARLQLAKLHAQRGEHDEARDVLMRATADDWTRIDHFFYLGDLAHMREDFEEALQFYRYAATAIGKPPFVVWWIDLEIYGHMCAQRLVECYAALGRLDDALHWAERVMELLPEDYPEDFRAEARENIQRIEETIEKCNSATE